MPPTVWSGMIDELRIWDVVLNLTQIQELQYVGSDSACAAQEPHLQVLYNFNTLPVFNNTFEPAKGESPGLLGSCNLLNQLILDCLKCDLCSQMAFLPWHRQTPPPGFFCSGSLRNDCGNRVWVYEYFYDKIPSTWILWRARGNIVVCASTVWGCFEVPHGSVESLCSEYPTEEEILFPKLFEVIKITVVPTFV